jgi:adenylate kinase family enzyme
MPRIHITGASGTGTTTLGRALAGRLRVPHFDSDDYYWIPTVPPFRIKRDSATRDARLAEDLARFDAWVWSGSALSWAVDPALTLCVFLTVPRELRIERLRARELASRGPYDDPATSDEELAEFLAWAASYEDGSMGGRTLQRHEAWLRGLTIPVLRIDGAQSTEARVALVERALAADAG